MKWLGRILLVLFVLNAGPGVAQSSMFKQKKERKKVWRKWRSKREAYNPYLNKKSKNKPSVRLAKQEKRELKRQRRKFKRDTRRAKRGGNRGPR